MTLLRRLGLHAWLVAAFVALGAVASLTAVVVVLPNLEGSIRKDEIQKTTQSTLVTLSRISVQGRSLADVRQIIDSLVSTQGADIKLTSSGPFVAQQLASEVTHGFLDADSLSSVGAATAQGDPGPRAIAVRIGGTDVVQAAALLNIDGQEAVLEVGQPVAGTAARLALVRRRVLLAISMVLGLAILTGLAIARFLGARMRRLAGTAATLAKGDLSARAEEESPVELSSLASSLNLMAARLEGLVDETVSDRDRARGLVASLAEGVLAVSDRGEVTVANAAARMLLGLPSGTGSIDLRDLPASVRQAVEEARDGEEETAVVEAALSGGVEVLLHASHISREAGVIVTIRDVTEERRLNRARRDLIANVSHELKTPLTAVKGFLELLESDHLDPTRRREFLDLMGQEVERLERLIAEQLELARIDAGALPLDRGPHDLGALAEDVTASRRLLAEREGVELIASIPPSPVMADVDPARVEQILLILLDNALKHTPPGGKVTVGVGHDGGSATLSVRDTGAGIPTDAQPFIFDRFYQADPSREGLGLGLGLSIARGLAEAHGGAVDVRSAQGVGSVFTVRLPLVVGAAASTGARA